jgi:hypothetical protein
MSIAGTHIRGQAPSPLLWVTDPRICNMTKLNKFPCLLHYEEGEPIPQVENTY